MSANFKGRLYRMFAINVHWVIRGLWSVAKKNLNEFTLHKVHIHGGDYKEDILKLIDAENLEQKFGGKLPNKEKDFFPPQMHWTHD